MAFLFNSCHLGMPGLTNAQMRREQAAPCRQCLKTRRERREFTLLAAACIVSCDAGNQSSSVVHTPDGDSRKIIQLRTSIHEFENSLVKVSDNFPRRLRAEFLKN